MDDRGSGAARVRDVLAHGDRQAWSLAALTLALRHDATDDLLGAATAVLGALGIDPALDLAGLDAERVAGQAAAPLLQTATLVGGSGRRWVDQSDDALLAQGRTSAQGAGMFVTHLLPALDGLGEALARPGARMLDVGTGTAALAVAYAEALPMLTVVGIDVWHRVLDLARRTVAAAGVADRIELREQDVATLDERDTYDLAWLPAPFCPAPAVRAGVPAIAAALRPGGWLMLAHGVLRGAAPGAGPDAALDDALTRFKTVAFGGTALDDAEAQQLLAAAGLVDVRTAATPPGAPAITVGRRPR